VLRKAGLTSVDPPGGVQSLTAHERALCNHLSRFPEVLEAGRLELLPHLLTTYLHDLCQTFNAFYNTEPILKTTGTERTLRLFLTDATAGVLRAGADILTIRVPEKM
jgi:arginyl-tRNA synthetase